MRSAPWVRQGGRSPPKLKFQIVLEVLRGQEAVAQAVKAFGVHRLREPRLSALQAGLRGVATHERCVDLVV